MDSSESAPMCSIQYDSTFQEFVESLSPLPPTLNDPSIGYDSSLIYRFTDLDGIYANDSNMCAIYSNRDYSRKTHSIEDVSKKNGHDTNIFPEEKNGAYGKRYLDKVSDVVVLGTSPTIGHVAIATHPSQYVQSSTIHHTKKISTCPSPFSNFKTNQITPDTNKESNNHELNVSTIKEKEVVSKAKPCKCKKSRCLKLYCECFAKDNLCINCNCEGCANKPGIVERESARDALLYRNPHAFQEKVQVKINLENNTVTKIHNRGCSCKKSGCMKNYCECRNAGVSCGQQCKCSGCGNFCSTNTYNNYSQYPIHR